VGYGDLALHPRKARIGEAGDGILHETIATWLTRR
jgi:hypothetical protein